MTGNDSFVHTKKNCSYQRMFYFNFFSFSLHLQSYQNESPFYLNQNNIKCLTITTNGTKKKTLYKYDIFRLAILYHTQMGHIISMCIYKNNFP